MIPENVSKEEFLAAVRQGVHDAIQDIIRNATDADFFASIKDGARQAIAEAMPASLEIEKAIAEGVYDAFPFSDRIADAIYGGVREGVQERKARK